MPEEILHLPQLVVGVTTDGELHLVSFRGEWLDLQPARRSRQNVCRRYANSSSFRNHTGLRCGRV